MHRRRTNARALIAQILRTMKRQANRLPAINARGRAIAHHAHGDLAHHVVRGLAPRRLKKTKHWYAMVWHNGAFGLRLSAFGQSAFCCRCEKWLLAESRAPTAESRLFTHDSANNVRCRPNGRETFRETDWQRRSCRWSAEFDPRRVLVMSSPRFLYLPSPYQLTTLSVLCDFGKFVKKKVRTILSVR
jgi:hypothetical protein